MNISSISKQLKSKDIFHHINFAIGLILVFFIPFGNKIISPIIGLWILSWLLEGNFKTRFSNFKNNKAIFFLLIFFYLWHVIGLLYSNNQKSGMFDLEIKLSLIIFPIIFSGLCNLYKDKFSLILKSFIIGNLIASLICLFNAFFFSYNNTGFENFEIYKTNFLYVRLSVFLHPSYYAMYLVFCIISIEYLVLSRKINNKKLNILYIFCIIFFIFFIFLLSSRTGIISLFIICLGYFIYYLIKSKKIEVKIASMFMLLILFVLMLINARVNMLVNNFYPPNSINNKKNDLHITEPQIVDESSKGRLQIWKTSLALCSENILLGVGNGDIKEVLIEKYKKDNNLIALQNKLNVHNQFVETQLGQGIIGLLMLIIIFISSIWRSIRTKNHLLLIFSLLVGFNFIFESMLNTQAGVIFFIFFYCFFMFTNIHLNKLSTP